MSDTKPATSNGPLRQILNNGMRNWARKLQAEAPSRQRTSSATRSKSVGRVKDLEKSSQVSIEPRKPKKRMRMELGFDSNDFNETSSVSSLDLPHKRSRREVAVTTTSSSTRFVDRAQDVTIKNIPSTRTDASTPSKTSVGSEEDSNNPAKVRFPLMAPDHPSKAVSGPSREAGRIRRALSFSRTRRRTQSPEKNVEKLRRLGRNFFANIKDKIVGMPSLLPRGDPVHWSESFTALLEDKRACRYFREYLETERSEDNLDFYIACREFRKITDEKKAKQKANSIYTTFVEDGAVREVNLHGETKAATKDAYRAGISPDVFRLAQDHIENLMKTDSYTRFLKSPLFAELERVSPPFATPPSPRPPKSVSRSALVDSPAPSPDSFTQMAMIAAGNTALAHRTQLRSQDSRMQTPIMDDATSERARLPRLRSNSFYNLRTPSGCP